MTSAQLEHIVAPDVATAPAGGEGRTRFAFLAETSRCLGDSLDLETTLATVAGVALPQFGVRCMVDIIAPAQGEAAPLDTHFRERRARPRIEAP